MNRDLITLADIAEAARLVSKFVENFDESAFLADPKTQSSVLYQLLVMGEAVKRLSRPFRAAHPDLPWLLMAGMRDHVIHAYDAVDWEEVWKTASRDVPDLLARLQPLLPGEPGEPG